MTIYQVVNKHNEIKFAYIGYEIALEAVAKLNKNANEEYTINALEDDSFYVLE
jgi:hypothetical protein